MLRTTALAAGIAVLLPCAVPAEPEQPTLPRLDWGVELELELSDAGSDADEPDPHFQIDQLYLYPVLELSPELHLSADIAVKDDTTYIEEAWLRWSPGERFWLKAGLDDPVIANVDRVSEAEILLETAFYRSDELGIKVGGVLTPRLAWWASATNGSELAEKQPSEDPAFPIIHDGRRLDGAADGLMFGAGLRLAGSLAGGEAFVMPWAYSGGLDDADRAFLQSIAGYGISSANRKRRHGANAGWESERLSLLAQVLEGQDGDLDRSGMFVQPAWRVSGRYRLMYRYNRLDVDLPAVAADPRTWDRTQHVFALITTLAEGVLLKTEYYLNDEDTGGADVSNDELLLQLQVSWPP